MKVGGKNLSAPQLSIRAKTDKAGGGGLVTKYSGDEVAVVSRHPSLSTGLGDPQFNRVIRQDDLPTKENSILDLK